MEGKISDKRRVRIEDEGDYMEIISVKGRFTLGSLRRED